MRSPLAANGLAVAVTVLLVWVAPPAAYRSSAGTDVTAGEIDLVARSTLHGRLMATVPASVSTMPVSTAPESTGVASAKPASVSPLSRGPTSRGRPPSRARASAAPESVA